MADIPEVRTFSSADDFSIRIFDDTGEIRKIMFSGDIIEHRIVSDEFVEETFSLSYANRIIVFSEESDNDYGFRASVGGYYVGVASGTDITCAALDGLTSIYDAAKLLFLYGPVEDNELYSCVVNTSEAGEAAFEKNVSATDGAGYVALYQGCISHRLFMSVPLIDYLTGQEAGIPFAAVRVYNTSKKKIHIYSIRED